MTAVERIGFDLSSVRAELMDEMGRVPEGLIDWAPVEGMRTYRGQLLEIGATERQVQGLIKSGDKPDWQPLLDSLSLKGDTLASLLSALNEDRDETLRNLRLGGESALAESVEVPEGWRDWFGSTTLQRADLYRWILQHEYYHLGQIVSYNWSRGDDPYKR